MPSVGDPLTRRELQILALVGTGKRNEEVARRIAVCDDTVKFHLKNIFRKLGAKCRTEAVFVAQREGLVVLGPEHGQSMPRPKSECGAGTGSDAVH